MSVIALVQALEEVVVGACSVASEESSWADVGCSFGDDGAGVVGEAVVAFGVEGVTEPPEVDDEE